MQKLFDNQGFLNISEVITQRPSYRTIMEDGVVSDQELKDQADLTIKTLRHLQSICNAEQQDAIVEALSELGVLFAAYHNYQLQNLNIQI